MEKFIIECPNCGAPNQASDAFSGCSALAIYCEANSEPSGWEFQWNFSDRPVYWSYKS